MIIFVYRFPCAVLPCNHPLLGAWRAARVATQLHGLLQKDLPMSAESRVIGTFKKDSLNQIQWFFSNDEDSLPFVTSKSMVLFLMFFFPIWNMEWLWKADWFGLVGNPGTKAPRVSSHLPMIRWMGQRNPAVDRWFPFSIRFQPSFWWFRISLAHPQYLILSHWM